MADNEPGPGARSRGPCEHGTPMTLLSSRARAASASAGAIGERVIGAVCCRSARAYLARRSAEGADGGAPAAPEGTAGEAPSAAEGDGNVSSGGESEGAGAAGVGDAGPTADNVEVASCCREDGAKDTGARGAAAGDASDLRCSRRRTARAAAHSAVRMEAASGSSGEP